MKVDFEKSPDSLIPAIIQDDATQRVLMLGYMNLDSLAATEESGRVVFYSRSRQQLWTKGETSGNYLTVKEILLDCDIDTILIKVEPAGPVCHTGAETCFGEINENAHFLIDLENVIRERKLGNDEHSYTASLFKKGLNKIAQKFGEEAVELIIEAKDDNAEQLKGEAADVLYHFLVLLQAKNLELNDVIYELKQRRSH